MLYRHHPATITPPCRPWNDAFSWQFGRKTLVLHWPDNRVLFWVTVMLWQKECSALFFFLNGKSILFKIKATTTVMNVLLILISVIITGEIFLSCMKLIVHPRAWIPIVYQPAHTKLSLFATLIIYWNCLLDFWNPHYIFLSVEERTMHRSEHKKGRI